ncbi:MAG: hypothetical protein R2827_02240 [Bdellovibrionales bacterium]
MTLFEKIKPRELVSIIDRLLAWADTHYDRGNEGIRFLNWRCALAIQAASNIYSEIGNIVRRKQGSAWDERAYTSTMRKSFLAFKSALQTSTKTAWQIPHLWYPRKDLDILDFK